MIQNKNFIFLEFKRLVSLILCCLLTVTFLYSPSFSIAQESEDEIREEIEDKKDSIKEKSEKLKDTEQEVNDILNSSYGINQKINLIGSKITDAEAQIESIESDIKERLDEISRKETELDDLERKTQEITISLYKTNEVSLANTLFQSDSSRDYLRAVTYKKYAIQGQKDLFGDLQKQREALLAEKEDLEATQEELAETKTGLEESLAYMRNERTKLQQQYAAAAAKQNSLQEQIQETNKEIANLDKKLQAIVAAKVANQESDQSGGNVGSGGFNVQAPTQEAGEYKVYIDGEEVSQYDGLIRLEHSDSSQVFQLNGDTTKSYRGDLEFRSDTNVFVINETTFDEYLHGIGEVPSSWPMASLEAQAIAARTYALKNVNKRSSLNYNLRDDVYDQNYVGYYKESAGGPTWVEAVNNTNSEVVISGGSMVATYYHSTCGGHTLASEEVWVSALPYTRAKSDWYQNGSGEWVSYDAASPWSYKKWGDGTIDNALLADLVNAAIYYQSQPGNDAITANIPAASNNGTTPEEMLELVGDSSVESQIGTITSLDYRYNNGSNQIDSSVRYTQTLVVNGENGSLEIPANIFKTVYNLRSPGTLVLWSNLWEPKQEGGVWNFYSRGYPHRVGMCQWGAYGRANAGQSYEEILKHYYTGVEIASQSEPEIFRIGLTKISNGDISIVSASEADFYLFVDNQQELTVDAGSTLRIVKQ